MSPSTEAGRRLPDFPVVVVHLEDPAGSGLAACCGLPFQPSTWTSTSRWLCPGCANAGRPAEARAALLAELEAGVTRMPGLVAAGDGGNLIYGVAISRAAVLDLIRKAGK